MLRNKFRTTLLAIVLVFSFGSASLLAWAQEDAPWVYFKETGHVLRAPFLDFYKATGGFVRYGYPITDDFVDPNTRLLVQYFQKARLEWHPTNPVPYKIQLGLLGEELGKRTPGIPVKDIPPASDPSCVYFPETGHTICYKFLEFWRKAGGLDMFGYPITEYTVEDGVIVQYFQRARMEWQPSNPVGHQIQLTAIGDLIARGGSVAPKELEPRPAPNAVPAKPVDPASIVARGSVLDGFVAPGAIQSAYVLVVDQLRKPVTGAAVSLIVHYPLPQGDVTYQLAPTDQQGVTQQAFDAGGGAPGTIISLEFIVSYPGLKPVRTPTSYVLWYQN